MQIISHRGYWKTPEEKNTIIAFNHSFDLGFGTETDIRDHNKELVIAHDLPEGIEILFEDFLKEYLKHNKNLPLAINIKADGLQEKLIFLLGKYNIKNYFLFDMSVADAIVSFKKGLNCFTRVSEYEKEPSFYENSVGVWIDSFYKDWIEENDIEKHLNKNKKICIVSPELHKREYKKVWQKYLSFKSLKNKNLLLCTDKPEEAQDFFRSFIND